MHYQQTLFRSICIHIPTIFAGVAFGLFVLLRPGHTSAACTGASPTWTSTPDSASVQTCIDSASAGDTINVSSGTATWGASAVVIPTNKPILLIGSGSSNTIITLTGSPAVIVNEYIGKEYVGGGSYSATRISGIKFYNSTDNGYTAVRPLGQGWRIDNCIFENTQTGSKTTGVISINTWAPARTMQSYGLIDSNAFIHGKINVSNGGSTSVQVASWSDALDLGGGTAVYIEDNTFTADYPNNTYKQLAVDTDSAAKLVVRYNTFNNNDIMTHGLQSVGGRGTRKFEYYGNDFADYNSSTFSYMSTKAGTGVAFVNNITGTTASYAFNIVHERTTKNVDCLGVCDGSSSHIWDGNESGQNGWLCLDQPGTGGDSGWSGYDSNCGGTPTTQIKMPIYIWKLLGANQGENSFYNSSSIHVQENRDYYLGNSSCSASSCSSGVGVGSSVPTGTCTTGVAYWKTSQSLSDISSYVGANPATPISGVLYRCTSANTWETYYTPYTYPHPLRNENQTDANPPSSPTGLTVN